jgi:hypothetical protein
LIKLLICWRISSRLNYNMVADVKSCQYSNGLSSASQIINYSQYDTYHTSNATNRSHLNNNYYNSSDDNRSQWWMRSSFNEKDGSSSPDSNLSLSEDHFFDDHNHNNSDNDASQSCEHSPQCCNGWVGHWRKCLIWACKVCHVKLYQSIATMRERRRLRVSLNFMLIGLQCF